MAKLAGVEKIASNSCETSVACCESMAPERVAAPSTAPSIAEEEEGSASPRVSRRSLDMAAVWACLAFLARELGHEVSRKLREAL